MTVYKLLPRKLDVQIAVICAFMMVVLLPVYVINEVRHEIAYAIDTTKQETRAVVRNISQASIKYLLIRDYTSLENLLHQAAEFPGILDLQITDKKGRVVSDVVVENGQINSRFTVQKIVPPDNVLIYSDEEAKEIVLWEPISSGALVGWVRLNYSLQSAYQHAYQRLYDFLIHGGILITMMSVLLLLFLRKPMKLLGESAEFANKISDKTGDLMPVAHQSVELEKLTVALNCASVNLHQQEQTIQKIVLDLETQKHALDEHSIVSITDENGYISYANDKFLDITGYQYNEVIGSTHDIVKSGIHQQAFYDNIWNTITQGKVWKGEICNMNSTGGLIWLNTSFIPFMNTAGDPYQYVEISTDITEKKQAETELEQKNSILKELTEHLEDLVRQRTADLEKANEELVYLNNIKSEFVSIVSHELRTPLTSIKSFAEILEDDIEDMEAEDRQRYLHIINDEADRLGRLINDVLDLQKIDSGMMQWKDQVTDLREVIEGSYALFEAAFKEKNIDLYLDVKGDDFKVCSDNDKLKQVLNNLLSNALKFTGHGEVTISLSTEQFKIEGQPLSEFYQVSVADSGIGIPEDEIEQIFKRFHQVDSSETRQQKGSGLGLNICKEIIEHYNGQIWVEENLPEGSVFKFVLPSVIA